MNKNIFRRLSALLLAMMIAFPLLLTGCTESETEAAADLALSILEALEETEPAENTAGSSSAAVSSSQAISPPPSVSSVVPQSSVSSEMPVSSSTAPASSENQTIPPEDSQLAPPAIDEDGWYSSKDEVALYLHTYGKLPGNFLTKQEASKLGWVSSKGNLWEVAPGMSIGGDSFGNREGLLPAANGRKWYECDIDFEGGFRGAKRILFSNDGLIYYTENHYKSFELLYE